jgi:hypothetical protein
MAGKITRGVRLVPAILAVAGLAAPSALAAPNHSGTLGKIGDKFAWSDNNNRFALGTDVAAPPEQVASTCSDPGMPCDTTLLNVTAPGQLDIEVHDTGLVRPDIDIYLYASDKDGKVGDEIGRSESVNADEFASVQIDEPGYYLLRVAYYSGVQNNSTGKATLNEIPPPEEEEDF